ncbi:MAG: D-alanyl-D-alanine carboxypeptidase [Lachnospiraceae bacterium]|nr:D-alanyl-D-alanine carboxypeptidase [Lachnospiraceae bacterium]
MNLRIKRIVAVFCLTLIIIMNPMLPVIVNAAPLELASPSAVLMEASTGSVIFEKNADERRSPASITKIMTLLLIFDAIESGKITLEEEAVTSSYAMSMGGSKVFLEAGEIQTVDTLIKCIAVSSGNDASVVMAEHIAGSEAAFVEMMNEKAASLGLENTHFEDCCGLTSSENHYTSAYDVAIMSRELINHHPEIFNYCGIWMEDIVHQTARGESIFTLSSTNKLLKQYPYATGLKTGYTSTAKHCLSATAEKNGITMIAVILAAPDSATRFQEAQTMLEYGFACCNLYVDENTDSLRPVPVARGTCDAVSANYASEFRCISIDGTSLDGIEKEIVYHEGLTAPIEKGTVIGTAVYRIGENVISSVDILAGENVESAALSDYFSKIFLQFLL